MYTNSKINTLLVACILIMSTLAFIQYYLVSNTYQLTKDKYETEVRQAINKVIRQPQITSLEDKGLDNLKKTVYLYLDGKITKPAFFNALRKQNDSVHRAAEVSLQQQIKKNTILKDVRYKSQYDEFVIVLNSKNDTLLRDTSPPFIMIGTQFKTPNTIMLNSGNTSTVTEKERSLTGQAAYHRIVRFSLKRSEYIDISSWKMAVYKRMAGIFLFATGLIIAVIILFFLVFRAMINEKKNAEIKTDFANNITHELKTPLSSVELILKSLRRNDVLADETKRTDLLQLLERQYKKIQYTVDSVLESAMVTEILPVLEKTNVTNVLNGFFNEYHITSHHLNIVIDPKPQMLLINAFLLEKALSNLIDNAVKYSPPGSEIKVTAKKAGREYQIAITDNGPGIASKYHDSLFDKFFRVPEDNRHTVKGLGLGLYLSRQAIRQQDGDISIASSANKGCTFTIKLPADES